MNCVATAIKISLCRVYNMRFVEKLTDGEVPPRTLRRINELKAQGYPDLIAVEAARLKLDDKQVEKMQLEHATRCTHYLRSSRLVIGVAPEQLGLDSIRSRVVS
jgi:hypothetical protein